MQYKVIQEPIMAPSLDVPVPAPVAIFLMIGLSGILGWASWAYLRQAARHMRRLEFEKGANPHEIMWTLTGASFLSTNKTLFKVASFLVAFLLTMTTIEMLLVFFNMPIWEGAAIAIIITLPFLSFSISWKINFFDPNEWLSFSRPTSFIFRHIYWIYFLYLETKYARVDLPKELPYLEQVWDIQDELADSIPEIFEFVILRIFRRYGFLGMYWRRYELDELGDREMRLAVNRKIDELLSRDLPVATAEEIAIIKHHIIGD